MVIYILTKFGDDWLIFVDASVNKQIVDGRTNVGRMVSDHNSSLSTPCSCELMRKSDTVGLFGALRVNSLPDNKNNNLFKLTLSKTTNF